MNLVSTIIVYESEVIRLHYWRRSCKLADGVINYTHIATSSGFLSNIQATVQRVSRRRRRNGSQKLIRRAACIVILPVDRGTSVVKAELGSSNHRELALQFYDNELSSVDNQTAATDIVYCLGAL
jgi:hypothetical protein